jgi:hypothetical protein
VVTRVCEHVCLSSKTSTAHPEHTHTSRQHTHMHHAHAHAHAHAQATTSASSRASTPGCCLTTTRWSPSARRPWQPRSATHRCGRGGAAACRSNASCAHAACVCT